MAWRSASSAVEVWRAAAVVLGRPKCILETKRVDRRPEKSAASSDLEGGRGEREGKLGFRLAEVAGEAAAGSYMSKCKIIYKNNFIIVFFKYFILPTKTLVGNYLTKII